MRRQTHTLIFYNGMLFREHALQGTHFYHFIPINTGHAMLVKKKVYGTCFELNSVKQTILSDPTLKTKMSEGSGGSCKYPYSVLDINGT